MPSSANRDVYFSFFMFTVDLRPDDAEYTKTIVRHMHELRALGYAGFDLPIAPTDAPDRRTEVESYARLKQALDDAGLRGVGITTNVAATPSCDPSSMDAGVRAAGLAYLKSRVDITAALGGRIMAGPIVFPYGAFPTDANGAIWSDALQEWVVPRYRHAQPILDEVGDYARARGVKVAIEPVDHWETPAPNMVGDVLDFLDGVRSRQAGVCIDSAHVVMGSDGPAAFARDVRRASEAGRIHSVHVSPPDRGAFHDSWIPWQVFLGPLLASYDGPFLVETFNAIPVFCSPLRLTRRKFWIPGEDPPNPGCPDAYTVAREALAVVRREMSQLEGV
jgi:sugar phosphate isomerase/epimerase